MSYYAKVFAEGYRDGPILTENRAGVEHLVSGQHEAIWNNESDQVIELSYVNSSGHGFVVVALEASTLQPLRMWIIDGAGINEVEPRSWALSEKGRAAVTKLKMETSLGAPKTDS